MPEVPPRRAKVVTVLNLKGGVGKTHTVWLLSSVCQERSLRVLALDTDTQGNLTGSFLSEAGSRPGVAALFHPGAEHAPHALVRRTAYSHIDLVPAGPALARYDLADQQQWEKADLHLSLVDAVAELHSCYDYLLFDCPPRLSLVSFASLCASDAVIIPMEAADWDAQGLMQVTAAIRYVQQHYNPRLQLLGYLVSRFKRARAYQQSYLKQLRSECALYSKPESKPLTTREEALHLYDRIAFLGSRLPDGGIADTNYLWFSDWYLNNLNALFTAPLDYDLWRHLDGRSPIASRLYEVLLINFYSGTPVLRINYETLAQFLPVKPERYRSSAQRQLEGALQVLRETDVLAAAEWAEGRAAVGQLHLFRGQRLLPPRGGQAVSLLIGDEFPDLIKVKELRNLRTPERGLVAECYRSWAAQEDVRPTLKELQRATELIAEPGQTKARALIPLAVQRMKLSWPDAKTFGALTRYLPKAIEDYERQQRKQERQRQEQARAEQQRREAAEQAKQRAALKLLWDRLPEAKRQSIRQAVLATQPRRARAP